jgi:hypothetical protein
LVLRFLAGVAVGAVLVRWRWGRELRLLRTLYSI